MSANRLKIFVGAGLLYDDAKAKYQKKVSEPFDDLTFDYCYFTGMAEAELL